MERPPNEGELVYIARLANSDMGVIGHKFNVKKVHQNGYIDPQSHQYATGGSWHYMNLEYVSDSYEIF